MDRCPHIIRKKFGDESLDYCEITERSSGRIRVCLLERGEDCSIWEDIKEMIENETHKD